MVKKLVLVTGGAGFIGSHLATRLVAEKLEVHIVDNLSSGKVRNIPSRTIFHEMDIRNETDINSLFQTYPFTVVFHEAAQVSVIKSVVSPIMDADINIRGFITLMEAGVHNQIKKIIAASSGGVVYGNPINIPQREDDPLIPMSPYGIGKLMMEQYLRFYWETYHIPYIALRYGNVYGPRQSPKSGAGILGIFMEKILHGEQPVINGTGAKTRDYIHVSDIVEANIAALHSDYIGPINVGTGIETSVNTVFQMIKTIIGIDVPEIHGEEKSGEQNRSVLDIKRAEKILNWKPKIPLQEGLRETIAWYIDETNNQLPP